MNTLTELLTTALYYNESSSDKVYQCQIELAGERYVVNFAYGRRGGTLNTGTKTNVPVDFDLAQRIFDKLVKEKKSKGYIFGDPTSSSKFNFATQNSATSPTPLSKSLFRGDVRIL